MKIRKQKKEERLNQRRRTANNSANNAPGARQLHLQQWGANDPTLQALTAAASSNNSASFEENLRKKLQDLPAMIQEVNSGDTQRQIAATQQFRKLLSIERKPPIQQVIDSGVVSEVCPVSAADRLARPAV